MATKAVFRKHDSGEIIALFPDIPFDEKDDFCLSYAHVGQHGPADYDLCLRLTTPARREEYAGLAAELQDLGYKLKNISKLY